jgi:hypothetical protein
MLKNLKNTISPLHLVSALAVLLLAVAITNDTVTQTATGAFSEITDLDGEAAPQPETTVEETNTVNLQQGLQGYWRFDDPEVSRGYSLEFDGNDDYVLSSDSFSTFSNYSIAVWFRFSKSNSNQYPGLVSTTDSSGSDDYRQGVTFQFYDNSGGYYLDAESATIPNCQSGGGHLPKNNANTLAEGISYGKWHHATLVNRRNESVSIYVDGDLAASRNDVCDNPTAFSRIQVGARFYGSSVTQQYQGGIDDVRIYNRSLSESEIEDLYQNRPLSRNNLIFHQNFNVGPNDCDLSSNTACLEDKSGEGNDGTPQNFDDNDFNTGSGWFNDTPLNRPTVKDYSSNSHTGRFYGGNNGQLKNFDFNSSSGWQGGKIGENALKFDGNDSYVDISNPPNPVSSDNSLTISFRMRPGEDSGSQPVIEWDGAGHVWQHSSKDDLWFNPTGSCDNLEVKSSVELSEWNMYTVTYESSKDIFRAYKNGELLKEKSEDCNPYFNSDSLHFGHRDGDDRYFEGTLDDVKVYDRSLSLEEIRKLDEGKVIEEGLVGRWNFEAGDRKTAYDTSNFDREGILSTSGLVFESESVKNSQNLGVDNEITISSWVRPDQKAEEASGGDQTYYLKDNNTVYEVQAFTETGESKLEVRESIQADVLVVAGGGGGGGSGGGGGGAGGLIYEENYSLETGTYSVNVGRGGAGGEDESIAAEDGENSSFANIEARGGGGGGTRNIDSGHNGGSGGGGNKQSLTSGGNGTEGQGYDGGDGQNYGSCGAAGGGGGAGEKGGDERGEGLGGHGGDGLYLGSEFGKRYGEEGWFAGGGGGSLEGDIEYKCNEAPGDGGLGGGGDGSAGNPGAGNGMAHTGGGGGGGNQGQGGDENLYREGGDGGSGIVLVRYPIDKVVSVNSGEYLLGVENDKLIGSVGNSTVSAEIKGGSWQHVALNFNGSTQELYVNGERRVSSQFDGTVSPDSEDLVVGENFNGEIDETRVYNRSLSQNEIQRLAFQ